MEKAFGWGLSYQLGPDLQINVAVAYGNVSSDCLRNVTFTVIETTLFIIIVHWGRYTKISKGTHKRKNLHHSKWGTIKFHCSSLVLPVCFYEVETILTLFITKHFKFIFRINNTYIRYTNEKSRKGGQGKVSLSLVLASHHPAFSQVSPLSFERSRCLSLVQFFEWINSPSSFEVLRIQKLSVRTKHVPDIMYLCWWKIQLYHLDASYISRIISCKSS